jgi:hypothetical protein
MQTDTDQQRRHHDARARAPLVFRGCQDLKAKGLVGSPVNVLGAVHVRIPSVYRLIQRVERRAVGEIEKDGLVLREGIPLVYRLRVGRVATHYFAIITETADGAHRVVKRAALRRAEKKRAKHPSPIFANPVVPNVP